jgi:hypothetical protein
MEHKIELLKEALSSKKRSEIVKSLVEVFSEEYDEWDEIYKLSMLKTMDIAKIVRQKIQHLENYG